MSVWVGKVIQAVLLMIGSESGFEGGLLRGGFGVLSVVARENNENQWMSFNLVVGSTGLPIMFL